MQWMLPRPTDIMSLRLDNTERQTVELSDAVLSSTRYMASWLRQRSWTLPQNRRAQAKNPRASVVCAPQQSVQVFLAQAAAPRSQQEARRQRQAHMAALQEVRECCVPAASLCGPREDQKHHRMMRCAYPWI